MDDVADALDGVELSIRLDGDNKSLIFGSYEDGQYINFNRKYRVVKYNGFTSGKWSEEPKNWYIDTYDGVRESDSKFYYFIDNSNDIERETNKGHWAEGFINLIENWNEIKTIIEREVEKQLTERMEEIRKDTAEKIEKYEKVNDFEA